MPPWHLTSGVSGRLEGCREEERESAVFTELPAKHMFEVANILLGIEISNLAFNISGYDLPTD